MARSLSKREKRLLLILTVVVVPVLWGMWGGSGRGPGPVASGAQHGRRARADVAPRVAMDLLERPVEPFDARARDLFKYSQRPPSAAEVRRMREEAARQAREAERLRKAEEERLRLLAEQQARDAVERAKLPPPPPPPPRPPSITFRYIGYIGPKNSKIACFRDGENTLLAGVGETVQQHFKVVAINYDSVTMGYTKQEFKGQTQELPLARN